MLATTTYSGYDRRMDWHLAGLMAVAFVSISASVGALFNSLRATPQSLLKHITNLQEHVGVLSGEMDAHSIRVASWKTELETLLEANEGVLDSVERKRRSIAASVSKLPQLPGQNGEPPATPNVSDMTVRELEHYARSRGMLGGAGK